MINLSNINLNYSSQAGEVRALEYINMTINPEELVCIIGPSGCGKSSLLHLIGGFLTPTSGYVYIDNKAVVKPSSEVGIVFQKFSLFPWKTVGENIGFGLMQKRMPYALREETINLYLEEMGLLEFKNNYPNTLSIGMQQRVAIARAYANDPKVLLMDEPFASLDLHTKLKMRHMLLRLWERKKKTILFVTHDIEEAIMLGDKIIIMTHRPGKIKAELLINFPRPRDLNIVYSTEFIQMKQMVYNIMYNDC